MAKRRAVPSPGPSEPDPRQMEIGVPHSADAPRTTKRPAALPDSAALARRAIARRSVDAASREWTTVALKRGAAEALSGRAIRETRNVEDVVAEIVEREADR